ncbi:MAG TPA: helix-turn-helix transcriptional regulator [Gemmatimonadaceae bacterium]
MPSHPAPTSFLPLKHDVLLILLALGDRRLHGYGIIKEVEARSGSEVVLQTGALYRSLKRLLSDGFIVECTAPPTADSDDTRRRYYRVSPLGAAVRTAEIERMSRIVRTAKLTPVGKRPRLA